MGRFRRQGILLHALDQTMSEFGVANRLKNMPVQIIAGTKEVADQPQDFFLRLRVMCPPFTRQTGCGNWLPLGRKAASVGEIDHGLVEPFHRARLNVHRNPIQNAIAVVLARQFSQVHIGELLFGQPVYVKLYAMSGGVMQIRCNRPVLRDVG